MHEEAEDAETVVHADDDDVFVGEELAILTIFRGAAGAEAAPVDPKHDREFGAGLSCSGGPDVEREAVF